jgi:serine/threonine protein kinase
MDRYTRDGRIGHGLFSDVYKGTDTVSGELVALKITIPIEDRPPHDSRKEAQILHCLADNGGHTNIVKLIDSFTVVGADTELVIAMPLYTTTLDGVLKKHAKARYPSGWRNKLPESLAVDIVAKVCSGLAFVHKHGIIHRDVKPDNILFRDEKWQEPVLVDFGISWISPDNNGSEPPSSKITEVSTAEYRAPELLLGIANYTESIDMWAVGIIMCKLLSEDMTISGLSPYRSDIALLGALYETLGTPSANEWPEASQSWALGPPRPGILDPYSHLAPRASHPLCMIISQLLQYSSRSRLTAAAASAALRSLKKGSNAWHNSSTHNTEKSL